MKSPLKNALLAELYIALIALIPFYGERVIGETESIFFPIAFLSLFVLSASIMGFLFFYAPIREYLDGNKEGAMKLLVSTIAYFALFTLVMFIAGIVISKM